MRLLRLSFAVAILIIFPLVLLVALLVPLTTLAQTGTTYTTTADGCGSKNLGYCQLNIVNGNGSPFRLVLDARNNSQGPINTLTISAPDYPYTIILTTHGAYSGFVPNPDNTHTAYNGSGAFISDDTMVSGQFTFYAYYVATCSGRACAGAVVGWHYKVLVGSIVAVQ